LDGLLILVIDMRFLVFFEIFVQPLVFELVSLDEAVDREDSCQEDDESDHLGGDFVVARVVHGIGVVIGVNRLVLVLRVNLPH
jgi:hypothetical protein